MVVINVFMIYAVTKAAGSLEATVRRFYIARLGLDDSLAGKKKDEETLIFSSAPEPALAAEPENAVSVAVTSAAEEKTAEKISGGMLPDSVRYKNPEFREDYLAVQRMDALDTEAALRNVMSIQDGDDSGTGAAFRGLLELLDFDTAFRLSSRGAEEQEAILRGVLSPQQEKILDAYLDMAPGPFSVIDFYGYLEEKAQQYDGNYYVHRAEGVREPVAARKNVKNVSDDTVTAGVKIVYQNKLYDYSI